MVAAFFQKALKVWYWLLLAYGVHMGFKVYGGRLLQGLSTFWIDIIHLTVEIGAFIALLNFWKTPFSWLLVYAIAAIGLHYFNVISPAKLGLAFFFLSFYYQYQSEITNNQTPTTNQKS